LSNNVWNSKGNINNGWNNSAANSSSNNWNNKGCKSYRQLKHTILINSNILLSLSTLKPNSTNIIPNLSPRANIPHNCLSSLSLLSSLSFLNHKRSSSTISLHHNLRLSDKYRLSQHLRHRLGMLSKAKSKALLRKRNPSPKADLLGLLSLKQLPSPRLMYNLQCRAFLPPRHSPLLFSPMERLKHLP
jgi:hypothetical protein